MRLDEPGRDFIYKQEGVRLKAYLDVAGIPTIGVGFTYFPGGKKVKLGDTITLSQCDSMFTAIVADFENVVNKLVKVTLTQSQFNSLVSFSFNCGTAALAGSTLLKRINAKSSSELIKAAFLMWVKAGGKVNADLVRRRTQEADLFFKAIK